MKTKPKRLFWGILTLLLLLLPADAVDDPTRTVLLEFLHMLTEIVDDSPKTDTPRRKRKRKQNI